MNIDSIRHVFITGGASGIGLAIAETAVAKGIAVTVADVDQASLDALQARGLARLRTVRLDVRDRDGWAQAKAEAEAAFGPVDVLFNNAGVTSAGMELADMDPAIFERIVDIDLVGVFNGVHAFAADMRARRSGHIVNTASMAGISAPRFGVTGNYAAAKFGVVGMSEILQRELAPHGVGVSIYCPGQVDTGILRNSARDGHGVAFEVRPEMKLGEPPKDLGERLFRGVADNALYIVTHAEGWWPDIKKRHDALAETFGAYVS